MTPPFIGGVYFFYTVVIFIIKQFLYEKNYKINRGRFD